MADGGADGLDPITLEVIRNALPAISNEMSADLQRASYNMMIYDVRDYSCGIVARGGELVSQHVGGVSHFVADLGVIIDDAMGRYGADGFDPQDVLITNHQAVAGQHLNNIVVYVPVFFDGRLVCFSMVRAHWVDVGGLSTGFGAHSAVLDPWAEGLQLNQLKVEDRGVRNETLYQILRDNLRFPDAALGDLRSQIAACRLGARRVQELYARYSPEVVEASIGRIFDETERRCRNVVATIPDGEYEAESFLDHDGLPQDGHVQIHARVIVSGEDMTIDLSRCSAQRRAALNGRTLAAGMIAYKCLTTPDEPMNEGALRAVNVVVPEGTLMMARFPAPMSGWGLMLPTVVDTIFRALAPAMPDRIPAAHFGVLGGPVIFVGTRSDTGERFIVQSLEGGGWGGRPNEDGPSASLSVCQGDVRNAPIESIELRCPVVVEERKLRTDSAGAGLHRGGLGVDTTVRNLVRGMWNSFMISRSECPPWGINGGMAGDRGGYLVRRPDEDEFHWEEVVLYNVEPGSLVTTRTAGGGGWGKPTERDPERVLDDVREGFVSRAAAERDYGVVLDENTMTIDDAATADLRERVAANE